MDQDTHYRYVVQPDLALQRLIRRKHTLLQRKRIRHELESRRRHRSAWIPLQLRRNVTVDAAGYLWNGSPCANYDTSYTYNRQSNLTSLRRNGRIGASSYGLIDDLTLTLDGNWLTRVDDAATASAYNNGFEFKDAVKRTMNTPMTRMAT